MRHVSDDERRARLARRHGLAPQARLDTVPEVAAAVVGLHATEPASVHLAVAARSDTLTVADVEQALYAERSVVKQLAMRRTLFAFPRDLLPAAWGSASRRVAEAEGRRLAKHIEAAGLAGDGAGWLAAARTEILALMRREGPRSAQEVRTSVPMLDARVATSSSAKWGGPIPVAPRVLTWLGARGEIVRGDNGGHWRLSKPRWTETADWLGEAPSALGVEEGYATLVRRWLAGFGPGTEADLVWWLGGTKAAVRRALADVEAVEVSLDGGLRGYLLPDDLDKVSAPDSWVSLLPVLDPATMGWRDRDFYLDPALTPFLYDSAGNGGTTAWVEGRIVGAWVQDDDARVQVLYRADVSPTARRRLTLEAERLSAFLDGTVISSVYKSVLMKGGRLP